MWPAHQHHIIEDTTFLLSNWKPKNERNIGWPHVFLSHAHSFTHSLSLGKSQIRMFSTRINHLTEVMRTYDYYYLRHGRLRWRRPSTIKQTIRKEFLFVLLLDFFSSFFFSFIPFCHHSHVVAVVVVVVFFPFLIFFVALRETLSIITIINSYTKVYTVHTPQNKNNMRRSDGYAKCEAKKNEKRTKRNNFVWLYQCRCAQYVFNLFVAFFRWPLLPVAPLCRVPMGRGKFNYSSIERWQKEVQQ